MEHLKTVIVEMATKEDEKKWKTFLKEHFPRSSTSGLLNMDLVSHVEKGGGVWCRTLAIAVGGYGLLAPMFFCRWPDHYVRVADFEGFTQTDVYRRIMERENDKEKAINSKN